MVANGPRINWGSKTSVSLAVPFRGLLPMEKVSVAPWKNKGSKDGVKRFKRPWELICNLLFFGGGPSRLTRARLLDRCVWCWKINLLGHDASTSSIARSSVVLRGGDKHFSNYRSISSWITVWWEWRTFCRCKLKAFVRSTRSKRGQPFLLKLVSNCSFCWMMIVRLCLTRTAGSVSILCVHSTMQVRLCPTSAWRDLGLPLQGNFIVSRKQKHGFLPLPVLRPFVSDYPHLEHINWLETTKAGTPHNTFKLKLH